MGSRAGGSVSIGKEAGHFSDKKVKEVQRYFKERL